MTSGGKRGYKLHADTAKRIGESNKGRIPTAEALRNQSLGHLGQKIKPESIEKRTRTRKERGIKPTQEQKKKVAQSVKESWNKRERVMSQEIIQKRRDGIEKRRLQRIQ